MRDSLLSGLEIRSTYRAYYLLRIDTGETVHTGAIITDDQLVCKTAVGQTLTEDVHHKSNACK
jgi:hypothetical protein